MERKESFIQHIQSGYSFKGDALELGTALLDGVPQPGANVRIPLKTLNRHGLIAGATGTGKTVTLQIIAEQMAAKGIPVLLMDLKGDLSGLAAAGTFNEKIEERHQAIGIPYEAKASLVELLTISNEPGTRLRATVKDFGPVLFSKMLDLNDTQSGITAIIFKYAEENKIPLVTLEDFKDLMRFATEGGKVEITKEYGKVSEASVATILRKIIELETQGAELFFGEPAFNVFDLVRHQDGRGYISILRLTDIQSKPKLFSTFMLEMLTKIYNTFPEAGDLDKPKLCVFIDEAHLIFNEASKALLDQIESIIKLIRSKGIGIYFCTQNPYDIPEAVLSQLGLKVQHALRAFTEKDRRAIKKTADNYPISEYYKTEELLTSVGIGQALVTALNEKGIPTPLAAVHLRSPESRMGVLNSEEIQSVLHNSQIKDRYEKSIVVDTAEQWLLRNKPLQPEPAKPQKGSTRTKEKPAPSAFDVFDKQTKAASRTINTVGRFINIAKTVMKFFGGNTKK
ncbi:MAG TPA: helicase HerA-like domain-containing protein [Flavobacteriales bacterium]